MSKQKREIYILDDEENDYDVIYRLGIESASKYVFVYKGFFDKRGHNVGSPFFDYVHSCILEEYDCDDRLLVFLDNCKNINERGCYGYTLLHYACYFDNYEICELLIEKGADIYILTDCGDTPFRIACWKNNSKIAEYLGNLMLRNY